MTRSALIRTSALIVGFCSLAGATATGAWAQSSRGAEPPTVKLAPRARVEAVPTDMASLVNRSGVDAFLAEVDVLALPDLERMPRIVATPENRLILGQGDRAFARTGSGTAGPFFTRAQGAEFRIGRVTRPLRDPVTGEVLGQEVQFVGKASLLEEERLNTNADGTGAASVAPAVLRITGVKEEVRIGDRLFPVVATDFNQLKPSEPAVAVQGQVLGVYGNGVTFAGQNQIVVINRGTSHGLEPGHLLSVLKDSRQATDRTDGQGTRLSIGGENNGRLVVFRSFDKVAYALILNNLDAVKVGDRIVDR